MAPQPLMPKATAVWLVDNTALTFKQIADFVGLHELEVVGIADGAVAVGIKGMDPVASGQIDRIEIERCEKNPQASLRLKSTFIAREAPRKGPRYTPLSKRQDKPAAIAWLVRNHPELADLQITKLIGTTKTTIKAIRERTHWNTPNIKPTDPVALGLCSQTELDDAVAKAARERPRPIAPQAPIEESLAPLDDSLRAPQETPAFLETAAEAEPSEEDQIVDADMLFNLPDADAADAADEDEDEDAACHADVDADANASHADVDADANASHADDHADGAVASPADQKA